MFGSVVFLNLTLAESFFDGPWHSLTSGRASQTSLRASKACVARPLFGERTTFYPPYKKTQPGILQLLSDQYFFLDGWFVLKVFF